MMPAVLVGLLVVLLAGLWRTFVKAGKPGLASVVPFYNVIVLLEIAGRPAWWLLLLLIPIVNLVVIVMVTIQVAGEFGKGPGFGVGLAFLPFVYFPILGFGAATYGDAPKPPSGISRLGTL